MSLDETFSENAPTVGPQIRARSGASGRASRPTWNGAANFLTRTRTSSGADPELVERRDDPGAPGGGVRYIKVFGFTMLFLRPGRRRTSAAR